MSKRIVFFADGTWDSAQDDTNVYKLFKAIPTTHEQVAFYDDGVGSDGTPVAELLGGAMGIGLFEKIKEGYTKIAHSYEEGDELFLFGFSRGAYTARSLAGMIANCGLPRAGFDQTLVDSAFEAYRNRERREAILAGLAAFQLLDAKIKMIGVWDTVGALGIPAVFGGVGPEFAFLDTGLHADVKNAFHALSIDERRPEFPATLWNAVSTPLQRVEQIWFSGVHCDVGGGYGDTGLSDITLSWMMGKARELGLEIADPVWSDYQTVGAKNALGTLHESWSVLWGFPRLRTIPPAAQLSNSVAIRCRHEESYQPRNLTVADGSPSGTYRIVPIVAAPPDQG